MTMLLRSPWPAAVARRCACGDSTTEPVIRDRSGRSPSGRATSSRTTPRWSAAEAAIPAGHRRSWPRRRAPVTDERDGRNLPDLLADPQVNGELQLSFLATGAERDRVAGAGRRRPTRSTLGLGTWTDQRPGRRARTSSGSSATGDALALDRRRRLPPASRPRARARWVELPAADLDPRSPSRRVRSTRSTCTSSRDPAPYLPRALVRRDRRVGHRLLDLDTAARATRPAPGNPHCVSGPLPLDEPLGDRELLDGSTYPPSPVR